MKKIIYASLLSTSLVAPAVSFAQGSDSWTYSASVKMWNQTMTIDDGSPTSNTAITPVLGLSARKGQWFGVFSYFPKTNFAFSEVNNDGLFEQYTDAREEYDLAVGYAPAAIPGLSILLGYKDIKHGGAVTTPGEEDNPYTMKAPVLGIAYTKGLSGSVYLFTSAATNIGGSQKMTREVNGTRVEFVDKEPKYVTGEIGVGTVLDNGVSLGLGWRYQKLTLNVKPEFVALGSLAKIEEEGKGLTLTVGFGF